MTSISSSSRRIALVSLALVAVTAAQAQRVVNVSIPTGRSSVTLKGEIKGDASIDYVVTAGAGQKLSVTLRALRGSPNFNVLPPSSDSAMFMSSTSGNQLVGRMLPVEGKYRLRTYLMRAEARRNASALFEITVKVEGTALRQVSASQDKQVGSTRFNATADVPLKASLYPDVTTAKAGVIRRGRDGTATIQFAFKGIRRHVLFVKGKAVASDAADTVTSSKSGDEITVRIGTEETYRFPEAFLIGG